MSFIFGLSSFVFYFLLFSLTPTLALVFLWPRPAPGKTTASPRMVAAPYALPETSKSRILLCFLKGEGRKNHYVLDIPFTHFIINHKEIS